ncbi:hypothetical protein CGCSCA5_v007165 [Colletotrichum siamense]|nr:hypothetical protein CGCSCA5_v007165 [Colletotrichum siamense]
MSDWYQFCQFNHSKCSSLPTRRPGWTPSRLIDIGQANDESWKLIITGKAGISPVAQYASLSYRWGSKPQALMLSASTLRDFLAGQPIDRLPQTFKDFIVVARKFGFRYVWIDCLCIMQGCTPDWNHEVPTMRNVYANSACNVLACDSSDPGGGLFRHRNPNDVLPGLVETSLLSGTPKRYIVRDGMFTRRQLDEVKTLADRGWVFQERFLAPRALSFHGQRISWECCEGRGWEGILQGFNESISIMDRLLASIQQATEASHGKMTETTLGLWSEVVRLYSQCKLTKSEDKLLALMGVAKVFQELTGDTYLAGVWRSQLLAQLHWQTGQDIAKLPRRYKAPSWSWASVDSPVMTWFTNTRPYIQPDEEDLTLLEILDVGATSNAFEGMADVSDAWLKVRGKCFGCSYKKRVHKYSHTYLIRPDGDIAIELGANVSMDAAEYELADEGRIVLLLFTVSSDGWGWSSAHTMILLPVSGSENTYRRIGWAWIQFRCAKAPVDQVWFRRIEGVELLIV